MDVVNKNLKKAINEAIDSLDWNIISDFCTEKTGKKTKITEIKKAMKAEIISSISTMLSSGIDEMAIEYFQISIRGEENKHLVQILFTPTKSIAIENGKSKKENALIDEAKTIEDMMNDAVNKEKYELAAALRDRLNKLKNPGK